MSERKRILLVTGKRKAAIARAVIRPGHGSVTVNEFPVSNISPELARARISEPLSLAGERLNAVDVRVKVRGGGVMGQAEAARMAIARALVDYSRSAELRRVFTGFDRTMLAGDPRRKEPKKRSKPKTPKKHERAKIRLEEFLRSHRRRRPVPSRHVHPEVQGGRMRRDRDLRPCGRARGFAKRADPVHHSP